jgi:hypothetical protein
VLRDSWMFRAWQQGAKHLTLGCSWCHWKGLETYISKMPSYWQLGHLQPKLWAKKKGRESNWQFDSRPLKVGNRHLPDVRFESAIRCWKDLDEGYNFASDPIAIQLCSRELWRVKVPDVPPGQFRDSISGVPRFCAIRMPPPRRGAKNTIGSKVVAYSRVWAVVSLVCPSAHGKSQH